LKLHDPFIIISLVLCFKGIMLVAGTILTTVRNWASWSDRSCIMGDAEDEFSLVYLQKYYWLQYL